MDHPEGPKVGAEQQGLVVEHFFEMRHVPEFVHGVAVKAASEMIVHATIRHLPQSHKCHAERRLAIAGVGVVTSGHAEEQIECHRPRKFRRPTETAEFVIEAG